MYQWLIEQLGGWWGEAVWAAVSVNVLLGFVLVSAIFFVWLERKVSGRIQDRLGPTRVGGKFGWLQTLADGVKLLCKEDSIPKDADQFLFRAAPYLTLAGPFVAFLALPFGQGLVARELNIAVFFMLAVMSSEVFGIILAGYGSASKWAFFGGIREAAQVISYEVPRAICVIVPIIVVGSLNLTDFARVEGSAAWYDSPGLLWNWLVFHDPFTMAAFVVFFVCGTSSCKRAPFDLAEAESELVAGFHTEYSGFRWLLFFMAEYGSMFAISAIAALLFCGGWHTGLLPWELSDRGLLGPVLGNLINATVLILKGWVGVFVMMWVRWTLPRLRIDQVMMTCLKYLIPISCFLLVAVCLWELLVPNVVERVWKFLAAGVTVAFLGFYAMKLWTIRSSSPPGVVALPIYATTGERSGTPLPPAPSETQPV